MRKIYHTNMIYSKRESMPDFINYKIQKIISKNSFVFLVFVCAVLFAYGNILFGDFVFDDNIFIENNAQIRSPSNVEEIYSSSTTAGSGLLNDNFYRPNQQLIYTLLYTFFGFSPSFFHLAPLLFHIFNGFLIFLLFSRLGISRRASFLGSLLFLLHPILTQAVSYISGLSEPLVVSTILGALLIFLKTFESDEKFYKWLLLGALVFFIGLFSKESQVVSLGLMGLVLIFKWSRQEVEDFFKPILFILFLSAIFSFFLYIRINFLNFTGVMGLTGDINPYTENIWLRISTFVHILPEYFKMILFPLHLHYERPYIFYDSYTETQSIFSLIFLIFGFLASIFLVFKKRPELFFGFFWFLGALLPVSGVIPVNSIYLEHWLYMPIIGMIFFLCYIFDNLGEKSKNIIIIFLFFIFLLFSFRIMARNAEWGDPVRFYKNEIRYTKNSARIYNNMAMELADRNDCVSAIPNYEMAIAVNDAYPQTHHNLARCLQVMGMQKEAEREYMEALRIEPNFRYSLEAIKNLRSILEP